MKLPRSIALLLLLAGCALRIGTDPDASATSGNETTSPIQATWTRERGDSLFVERIDTLQGSDLLRRLLPVPDSTWLAVVDLEDSSGAWLAAGDSSLELLDPFPFHLRWRDSVGRASLRFLLPGTGIERFLDRSDRWTDTVLSVYASTWKARIVGSTVGRNFVWSIDSVDLSSPLDLDLSRLPDSSCAIRKSAADASWECAAP